VARRGARSGRKPGAPGRGSRTRHFVALKPGIPFRKRVVSLVCRWRGNPLPGGMGHTAAMLLTVKVVCFSHLAATYSSHDHVWQPTADTDKLRNALETYVNDLAPGGAVLGAQRLWTHYVWKDPGIRVVQAPIEHIHNGRSTL